MRYNETMKPIRKHIEFSGWVQGVGFRWRALNAANSVGATGWVRNEYDGTVTMEIQGSEEMIDHVITSIEAGRYVKITSMKAKTIPVVPKEHGFYAD